MNKTIKILLILTAIIILLLIGFIVQTKRLNDKKQDIERWKNNYSSAVGTNQKLRKINKTYAVRAREYSYTSRELRKQKDSITRHYKSILSDFERDYKNLHELYEVRLKSKGGGEFVKKTDTIYIKQTDTIYNAEHATWYDGSLYAEIMITADSVSIPAYHHFIDVYVLKDEQRRCEGKWYCFKPVSWLYKKDVDYNAFTHDTNTYIDFNVVKNIDKLK